MAGFFFRNRDTLALNIYECAEIGSLAATVKMTNCFGTFMNFVPHHLNNCLERDFYSAAAPQKRLKLTVENITAKSTSKNDVIVTAKGTISVC